MTQEIKVNQYMNFVQRGSKMRNKEKDKQSWHEIDAN